MLDCCPTNRRDPGWPAQSSVTTINIILQTPQAAPLGSTSFRWGAEITETVAMTSESWGLNRKHIYNT